MIVQAKGILVMTKQEFIEYVASVAVKDWNERRIMLPSLQIAQACKESAFGTSELAINANALFGIKLNGWTGKSYRKKADEQKLDGTMVTEEDTLWRAYDNWGESIIDHTTYIAERRIGNQVEPNFKAVIGETNIKKAIAALVGNYNRKEIAERCTDPELRQYVLEGTTQFGYATGLGYAQSLLDDYIIKYDLTKYDAMSEVEVKEEVVEEEVKKVGVSNSPLVDYVKISPNKTSPRNHVIDTITIHCVVGQISVESLGNVFAPETRKASSNYGIGPDGRVGMYVEEKDRSWCSSNRDNDHRAITIEVASDKTHPYAVTEAAMKSLIELCADICKRNGIKELKWKGDKSLIGQVDKQNMTVHRWFAAKACPGDYLYERHGYIADEVNKLLNTVKEEQKVEEVVAKTEILYQVVCGSYKIKENAEAKVELLKANGFDAFIQVKEVKK